MDESAGTTTMSVIMGADDATEAADPEPVTYVTSGTETVAVTGVELGDTSINLTEGNTQTLVAVVKPADATNQNVTWSSSDPNVATVENGVVTAVAPGQATITVTTEDGNKTDTCVVTVSAEEVPAETIALDKDTATVYKGKSETLKATLTPSNATSTITWVSSDTEVATVANGVVTAVAVGEATITAFVDADENGVLDDGEVSATCAVTVVEAPDELLGDIDGNGSVDANDAIKLFQYSMFPSVYPIEYTGSVDFDKNGSVDSNDAIRLFQYSMFPGIYPIE